MADIKLFQSAGTLNLKTLGDKDFLRNASQGMLSPINVQLSPTNHCNRRCKFCSFSDRDREIELPFRDIKTVVSRSKEVGAKAYTITGGGEPTVHPDIVGIIDHIISLGLKCSLTTNGINLSKVRDALNHLTWTRISFSDSYHVTPAFLGYLSPLIDSAMACDWSASYVVTNEPDLENLERVIDFAIDHNFTHVRIVSDILDSSVSLEEIRNYFCDKEVEQTQIFFQDRTIYTPGMPCWAGFVKPFVDADGWIYACCGAQYAIAGREHKMPPELRICRAVDIHQLPELSRVAVKGRICSKCYYSEYNELLASIMDPNPIHKEFV